MFPGASLSNKPTVMDIDRRPFDNGRTRQGVSAVAAIPAIDDSLSFVSAGYDHVVQLWSLDFALTSPPISCILNVRHNSVIQSMLAIKEGPPKLLSAGADCTVNVYDLRSEHTEHTIRTSNSVYQIHSTDRSECFLLEVSLICPCTIINDFQWPLRLRIETHNMNYTTIERLLVALFIGLVMKARGRRVAIAAATSG